ncbi:MAG: CIA30 family protein, partial [Betaproteobacteria bacterium]|nr:CIA30 family protein [Betaproteobacteria bacterium]
FRGRSVQAPQLSFSDVIELGILIADKQAGSFRLQLKTVKSS